MVIDQLEMDELTTAVENKMEATVAEISSDDDNTDAEEAEEDEAEDNATTPTSIPIWLAHYNFLSLLNLPDIIKEFGST